MAAQTAAKASEVTQEHPLIILETPSLEKALTVILVMGYDLRRMRKGALKQGKDIILFDPLLYGGRSDGVRRLRREHN